MPTIKFIIPCRGCNAQLSVDAESRPEQTDADTWVNEVEPKILKAGWAVKIGPKLGRYLVCPACVTKAYDLANAKLPKYELGATCVKCGKPDPSVRWCDGSDAECGTGLVRGHLHHACERCGYTWATECMDAKRQRRKSATNHVPRNGRVGVRDIGKLLEGTL